MIGDYIIRKHLERSKPPKPPSPNNQEDKRIETSLVKNLKENKHYVLKQYSYSHFNKNDLDLIFGDIEVHNYAVGNGLPRFKEKFYHYKTDTICFVYEYVNGGNLKNEILGRKKYEFDFLEEDIIQMVYDISNGLKNFHDMGRFYGCLNLENILLNKMTKRVIKRVKLKERSFVNIQKIRDKECDLEEVKAKEYSAMVEIIKTCLTFTDSSLYSKQFQDFMDFFMGKKSRLVRPSFKDVLNMRYPLEVVKKREEEFGEKMEKQQLPELKDMISGSNISTLKTNESNNNHRRANSGPVIPSELLKDILHENKRFVRFSETPNLSTRAVTINKDNVHKKNRARNKSRYIELSQPVIRFRSLMKIKNKKDVKTMSKKVIKNTLSKLFPSHSLRSKSLPKILSSENIGIIRNPRKRLDRTLNKYFKPRRKSRVELKPMKLNQFEAIEKSLIKIHNKKKELKIAHQSFGINIFEKPEKLAHSRKGSVPLISKPKIKLGSLFKER